MYKIAADVEVIEPLIHNRGITFRKCHKWLTIIMLTCIIFSRIIHLMETGLLRRFQNLMLLSMPSCDERTTFNSARLADVYSAFFVLGFGWVASFLILILEVLWWKRKNVNRRDRLNKNTFEKARERPATKILYHWQPR